MLGRGDAPEDGSALEGREVVLGIFGEEVLDPLDGIGLEVAALALDLGRGQVDLDRDGTEGTVAVLFPLAEGFTVFLGHTFSLMKPSQRRVNCLESSRSMGRR